MASFHLDNKGRVGSGGLGGGGRQGRGERETGGGRTLRGWSTHHRGRLVHRHQIVHSHRPPNLDDLVVVGNLVGRHLDNLEGLLDLHLLLVGPHHHLGRSAHWAGHHLLLPDHHLPALLEGELLLLRQEDVPAGTLHHQSLSSSIGTGNQLGHCSRRPAHCLAHSIHSKGDWLACHWLVLHNLQL